MNETVWAVIILPAIAGLGIWQREISNRVSAHDEVISKLDDLITLLLEDRLANSTPRSREKSQADS